MSDSDSNHGPFVSQPRPGSYYTELITASTNRLRVGTGLDSEARRCVDELAKVVLVCCSASSLVGVAA